MKNHLPRPMKELADQLSELPSIGPRQAIRLVFYLAEEGQNSLARLSKSIAEVMAIKTCRQCFFFHMNTDGLCDICRDPARNQKIIAIVEKETDLLALENTKIFGGRYFIFGTLEKSGLINETQRLRLQNLKTHIEKNVGGQTEEIIIALSPTRYGDFYSDLIRKELAPLTLRISKLAIGLPRGAEIEFADDETLGESFRGRSSKNG
ncbi:MAG: toprim domain-containing protein [Patescibacteria group bacterium]